MKEKAKKTTRKPGVQRKHEKNLGEAPTEGIENDLMPFAYQANNKALQWLDQLDRVARKGDADAIRMFYSITCGMVARLNEIYANHSQAVREWPILLPQNRNERKKITEAANAMRIGSVAAGGRGQPDKLGYDSEKGFAIKNLQRVSFARSLLQPLAPVYADMDGKPIPPPSMIDRTLDEPEDFSVTTGIFEFDRELLSEIGLLPDYTPETRVKWISIIVRVLELNSNLVPPAISKRSKTRTTMFKSNGTKLEDVISERGGRLAKTVRDGLRTVSAVPGVWGD